MKVAEIRADTTITEWLSNINAADNTRESYITAMKQFCEFTHKKPLQLLEEAEAEIKSGLLMRERKISTYLREFREKLEGKPEGKKLAPLTVKNRMNAVCSFYKSFNIQLPFLPRSMQKAKPDRSRRGIPTKEDIQDILTHTDELERAIILTGISSGLSVNEIANLKVRDFTDGYDAETGITTLQLVRQKTDYEFVTFLSPEASRAIQVYLTYRGRKSTTNRTAQINQLKKQRVIYDSEGKPAKHGYLFVARIVSGNYLKIKKELVKEEMRKLDRLSILVMYRRLNEDAQKSSENGNWNVIRSHTMRKFFYNQLRNNGADEMKTEFMMGHSIVGSKAHYWINDPSELKEMYKQYVHHLTIIKEPDETLIKRYEEQIKKNKELETDASKMAVERSEYIALSADHQALKAELEAEKAAQPEREAALIQRAKEEFFTGLMEDLQHPKESFRKLPEHLQKMFIEPSEPQNISVPLSALKNLKKKKD